MFGEVSKNRCSECSDGKGLIASVGILCFASKESNLLMWAHYANNHEGICIELDKTADFFTGKYKNATEFFGKTMDDHYQNIGELRKVIYTLELATVPPKSDMYFYALEPKMIKSVILGCQMPVATKKEVYEKCKNLGIKVREAYVHSHQFKLDIVDYDEQNQSEYINMYNLNRMTR